MIVKGGRDTDSTTHKNCVACEFSKFRNHPNNPNPINEQETKRFPVLSVPVLSCCVSLVLLEEAVEKPTPKKTMGFIIIYYSRFFFLFDLRVDAILIFSFSQSEEQQRTHGIDVVSMVWCTSDISCFPLAWWWLLFFFL